MKASAFRIKPIIFVSTVCALTALICAFYPAHAYATVSQTGPTPRVSFTFDDGLTSSLTKAAPTLQQYGFGGTNYVTPGCVGTIGTCEANEDASYMTWAQITQLKNMGWEIGGHSMTHPLMTEISAAQLEQEVSQSKAQLEAHGFQPTAFATPFGDYNGAVEAAIAKYYTSHRGFHDTGFNAWPYTPYLLRVQQVQAGVSVATVKGYIDQAKANNQWLILVFHDIKDAPSTNPDDYEYSTADLNQIAAYIKTQNITVTNITDGLVRGTGNKLPNGTFDSGISGGWTTDAPDSVKADSGGNGNAPGSTHSIAMQAAATNIHLFSPNIAVDPSRQYLMTTYANIKTRTSGEVAIYVDEYDGNNNWVSGQYLTALTSDQLKDVVLMYNASSSAVKHIRLQYIVTGNSGIMVYIDSAQLYLVEAEGATQPDPGAVNLMPNGQFDSGISGGWTTDNPNAFRSDNTQHGSPSGTQYSIALTAGAANAHLFSPKIAVTPGMTYTIKAYVNLATLTSGEVGFYVDEYDDRGNWMSGKYITGKRSTGEEEITFDYTPPANATSISLQIILVGNSGISGYLDDIRWHTTAAEPTPEPDPQPTPTNLVPNGSFQSGIGGGWTTDSPANVVADSGGNGDTGEEAVNSIKLTAAADKNAHLFSPKVAVQPTNYTLQVHLNITAITSGEIGFYIDEYDANDNWVGGTYITSRSVLGSATATFGYTPSTATVAKASLQVIVTANSGINAFIDNVRWTTTTA